MVYINKYNKPEKMVIKEYTNEYIDNLLKFRNITRIGDVINYKTKILFKCNICNYEWKSIPYNIIIKHSGCHLCHKRAIITNDRIDNHIKNKKFIRLDDVKGSRNPIKFKCLIDGYEWEASPTTILNKNTGCFKCLYKRQKYVKDIIFNTFSKDFIIEEYKIKCDGQKYFYKIDFVIKDKNIFIEYNGKQHYEPCTFGRSSEENANKKFIKQQYRDKLVKEYCIKNNIKLLELPYWLTDYEIETKIKEILN